MKLSAILEPLIAAGVPGDVLLATVRAFEAQQTDALERRRETDRKRQSDKRSRDSRDVTVTAPSRGSVTRGENNLLPEEITGKKENKEETAPLAPRRAHRLPADWIIPEPWVDEAVAAGMPRSEAYSEAKTMLNWSLSDKNGAKLEWHATWLNWFGRILKSRKGSTGPPGRRRTYADVAEDRFAGQKNGSEDVFGGHGNVEFFPPDRGKSRPHDVDLPSGVARRIAPGSG